jgi:O-antigen/teichoic acid export membrane protein
VKLAVLQGLGRHTRVARLRLTRQLVYLAVIFLLVQIGLAPSFLLSAFVPAEVVVALKLRKEMRAPGLRNILRRPWSAWSTLKQGSAYLFTDNALDMMLNIDLFVLGMFVGAWELGVYAEVAVLVRLFLLVPVACKPILRRIYGVAGTVTVRKEPWMTDRLFRGVTVALFTTAAVAVVYFLLYYPSVLDFFFELHGEQRLSLQVFAIVVPGLIFYGAVSAQEPVYEITGHADRLQQLTLAVAAANFILTLYLVPLAGIKGAATATMLSMLFYFVLFGRDLPRDLKLPKWTMLVGGLGMYLVFGALDRLDWPGGVTVWLVPLLLALLFYMSGFFGVGGREESGVI